MVQSTTENEQRLSVTQASEDADQAWNVLLLIENGMNEAAAARFAKQWNAKCSELAGVNSTSIACGVELRAAKKALKWIAEQKGIPGTRADDLALVAKNAITWGE